MTKRKYNNIEINKLYNEWMISQEILNKLLQQCNGDKRKEYEVYNILERWFITNANSSLIESILPSKQLTNDNNKKITDELLEKKIFNNYSSSRNFIEDVINIKDKFVKNTKTNIIIKYNSIRYKDFYFKIEPKRLNLLMRIGDKKSLLLICLKYASIISKGQQWGIPINTYRTLYYLYNVRCEGFASPFNSRLLEISSNDIKYCSLFPTYDKVFGSIGNIFDVDLLECEAWCINPPFIELIMKNIAIKIKNSLEEAKKMEKKLMIFYIMPEWVDADAYQILYNISDEYKKYYYRLTRNRYYYTFNDKKIIAKFNSIILVFDTYSDIKDNLYQDIEKTMLL